MNWNLIKTYGQRAGKEVLAMAEAVYLTSKDPQVSLKSKAILLGALIYLLSPVDAIPDFLPGGYVDDLSVMFSALVAAGQVGKKHLKECRSKQGLVPEKEKQP